MLPICTNVPILIESEHGILTDERQPLLEADNALDQRDENVGKDLSGVPISDQQERAESNALKVCSTALCFFVVGMNTAVLGVFFDESWSAGNC